MQRPERQSPPPSPRGKADMGEEASATVEERASDADDLDEGNIPLRTREIDPKLEKKLVRKLDLRICTIAGILASLNLLDSGIISSASVTRFVTAYSKLFRCLLTVLLSQHIHRPRTRRGKSLCELHPSDSGNWEID